MKLALIEGSPKAGESASGSLLAELKGVLDGSIQVVEMKLNKAPVDLYEQISECDSIVLAFPLYVDSVPAHVMSFMLEMVGKVRKPLNVYAIANNGFYEGEQNHVALEVVQNWCDKAGYVWQQGLGVGAGGMVQGIGGVPLGKGPKANLGKAYEVLSQHIVEFGGGENMYINPNFPRFFYQQMAHMGWRSSARKNGVKVREIRMRRG